MSVALDWRVPVDDAWCECCTPSVLLLQHTRRPARFGGYAYPPDAPPPKRAKVDQSFY